MDFIQQHRQKQIQIVINTPSAAVFVIHFIRSISLKTAVQQTQNSIECRNDKPWFSFSNTVKNRVIISTCLLKSLTQVSSGVPFTMADSKLTECRKHSVQYFDKVSVKSPLRFTDFRSSNLRGLGNSNRIFTAVVSLSHDVMSSKILDILNLSNRDLNYYLTETSSYSQPWHV